MRVSRSSVVNVSSIDEKDGQRAERIAQRTLIERPRRRWRLMIFCPALVFMRARKPCLRIFLMRLTLLG